MGNPKETSFSMKAAFVIGLLALVAVTNATLSCQGGYYKMHTIRTYEDSAWGAYDCLSAGVPCAGQTGAGAEQIIRSDWVANGGATYKAWRSNSWCSPEASGSAPWQGTSQPTVTWRFTLRRASRRALGKKCKGKKCKKLLAKKKGKKSKKDVRLLGKKSKKSKKMGKKSKKDKKRALGKKMAKKSKKGKKSRKLGKKGKKSKKGKKLGKKSKKSKKDRRLAKKKSGKKSKKGKKMARNLRRT